MIEKIPKTSRVEKINEENFSELKKFFKQLVKNFWKINNEDKIFLNENNFSEEILISNFRKIINRRANNWESWLIFFFKEMEEKNKNLYNFFIDDILFAKKILETNSKIFQKLKNLLKK